MEHDDTFACGIESLLYKQDLSQDFIKSLIDKIKAAPTIVLWGAGQGGSRTYDFFRLNNLHERILCFIDNNPRKQGGNCCGRPIISWDAFLQLDLADYLIVISCGEGDEIKSQCMKDGIPNDKILIPDLTLFNTAETDYRFIWKHISEFNILYQLLNDDWSRKTLIHILNYKITRDMSMLKQVCDHADNQYFDKELIDISASKLFVDCGAYIGDTIDSLLNKYVFSGEIYCFETDKENYNILERHMTELTQFYKIKTHCYYAAVWSQADTLRFRAVGSGSGYIDSSGDIKISAISLDSILKDKKVDFIKMDIEGAEMHALAGAFQVISKSKPILAISVYHDPSHLFQIPMLIKSMDANYKLYLRHYRECSVSETVCYAIPGGIG